MWNIDGFMALGLVQNSSRLSSSADQGSGSKLSYLPSSSLHATLNYCIELTWVSLDK